MFNFLIDFRPEQSPSQGNISQHGYLVVDLLHVLADEAPQGHRLAVPDTDTGGHFSYAEDGLIDGVFGEQSRGVELAGAKHIQRVERRRHCPGHNISLRCQDRAAVVNKPVEIDNFGTERKVNGVAIRSDLRLNLQADPELAGGEVGRKARRDHRVLLLGCVPDRHVSTPCTLRDLRRFELLRVREVPDNADGRLLPALRRDLRGGHEIDAFLLVKRADHHLELRVGEDPGEGKEARGGTTANPRILREKSIEAVDRKPGVGARPASAAQAARDGVTADHSAGAGVDKRPL